MTHQLAFSVREFCEAHSLSRSLFYKLLSQMEVRNDLL
jgi:hypothetical protein